MLIYDLICAQGHRFEGWFSNLDDLERQLSEKLLLCPVCGDGSISRRPSTFGLQRFARPEREKPEKRPDLTGAEQLQELFRRWAEFSSRLERDFDDVGPDFTDEALKIHYGVSARRNIRGLSTEAQEEILKKEGVDFFKAPILSRKSSSLSKN
ncbi:MAG: DUF1178 family protein [Candidatus Adiutrix sp.]|jgi:hypothetical protein|nr:DUF1178 family protein [Candidatus Adiutrix sp.]